MDSRCFDILTRLASTRLSRTAALRGVAAGALAAVLAAAGVATPAEARHKKGKKKPICLCPTADAVSCADKKAKQK
ncbi:MAG: hypothetical protein JNM64_15760, partial [Chloroflexia bacterium]|nr:hypothetical protein [Chloroflexia bacterium]